MVASKQVEIPIRSVDRQRGRECGALAQVIVRTAIPADLLMIAVPKVADLVVVEKNSRQLQKVCEGKLSENSWEVVAGKKLQAQSFQQKLQNKPVVHEEISLQNFPTNHLKSVTVPIFFDSFGKSMWKNPSKWRCLVAPQTRIVNYYLTRWKLHKTWISNGLKLLRWYETDLLRIETEFCQRSWFRNS